MNTEKDLNTDWKLVFGNKEEYLKKEKYVVTVLDVPTLIVATFTVLVKGYVTSLRAICSHLPRVLTNKQSFESSNGLSTAVSE